MSAKHDNVKPLKSDGQPRLVLDQKGLDAARRSLDDGAVTPSYGPWREDIIKLLNDALATELVCVLRYKRHYFTAQGLASPKIADEFRRRGKFVVAGGPFASLEPGAGHAKQRAESGDSAPGEHHPR